MITIYDITGNEKFSTPINDGCKRKFELMKEDSITLCFSLDSPIRFVRGDYVDIAPALYNPVTRFALMDEYKPRYNINTGGFDYELRLEADYFSWKHHKFMLTTVKGSTYYRRETSWKLTADITTHIQQIVNNLSAIGLKDYSFVIEEGQVEEGAKFIQYDNVDIITALNTICSEENFNCEWWVIGKEIHLGRLQQTDETLVFEIGVNAADMERNESENDFANRLYVFGSTRNLPGTYRKKVYLTLTEVEGIGERVIHGTTYNVFKVQDSSRKLAPECFNVRPQYQFDSVCGSSAQGFVSQSAVISGNKATTIFSFSDGQLRIAGEYDVTPIGVEWEVKEMSSQIEEISGTVRLFAYYNRDKTEIARMGLSGTINRLHLDPSLFQEGYVVKYQLSFEIDVPSGYIGLDYQVRAKGLFRTIHMTPYQDSTIQTNGDGVTPTQAKHNRPFLNNNGMWHFLLNTNPDTMNHVRHGQQGYTDMFLLTKGAESPKVGDVISFYDDVLNSNVPISYYSLDTDERQTTIGVAENRLKLPKADFPKGYIQDGTLKASEVVEDVIILDDVYPREAGWTIGTLEQRSVTDETEYEDGSVATEEFPIYTFTNHQGVNFSSNYILKGETLKVRFLPKQMTTYVARESQSNGKLAGFEFDVIFNPKELPEKVMDAQGNMQWNPDAQQFEIVRNENYGRMLPDATLCPNVGDEYILLGFDTKYIDNLDMVSSAEQELADRGRLELEKRKLDGSTYNVTLMSDEYSKIPFFTVHDEQMMVRVRTPVNVRLKTASSENVKTASSEQMYVTEVTYPHRKFYVDGDNSENLPQAGRLVKLRNKSWFDDFSHDMRILGFEFDLARPYVSPRYVVGQSHIKRRLQSIEQELVKLKAK